MGSDTRVDGHCILEYVQILKPRPPARRIAGVCVGRGLAGHLHRASGLRQRSRLNLPKSLSVEQSSAPCSIARAAR